ncbi:MAG: carboxylesterase family protein [Brevundimonas sp.]|uniref:carboxylesterase/lipase family protein n=1 Tax=Brevundimonas sp. TaxID=1871086 RepID=UPI002565F7CA|nr:carboxylesterase family protein [Brevundimonas sp.]MDK2748903.1 carboxylesterase family protein [Brevundimonas sp.]
MLSHSRPSFIGYVIVLALAAALTGAVGSTVAEEAITASGRLIGSSDAGTTRYLGVPYARPPVGDLRWRDPRPVEAWTGVRDATRFAPACPQTGVSMPGEPSSPTDEDCLYLNIWTPDATGLDGQSWPVIVWVPGGGLTNGSTSIPLYDGVALTRRGVVVVTVAYRLGALGFLAHPELTAESGMGGSGNYGLMDQIAALEWVRDNIAAFGGDPERVTVAGQSAGATSVSILMASPRAKGLFQRAIGQSGGLFEPLALAPRYLLGNAEADGLAYGQALGAPTLAQLRALPVDRFMGDGRADVVIHPVIEPRVLPEAPYDVFAAGRQSDVPLLVGFNAEEARSLTDLSEVTAQNFDEQLTARWGALPPALLEPYDFATDAEAREARADFERDLRFGWDIRAWARLAAAHGHAPVHAYYFSRRPPYPEGSVQQAWGAGHFVELWYMFDHLDQQPWPWTEADRRLADAMAGYWAAFARDGDPNDDGRPIWPKLVAAEERVLLLGEDIKSGVLPNNAALDVFDTVYESIR